MEEAAKRLHAWGSLVSSLDQEAIEMIFFAAGRADKYAAPAIYIAVVREEHGKSPAPEVFCLTRARPPWGRARMQSSCAHALLGNALITAARSTVACGRRNEWPLKEKMKWHQPSPVSLMYIPLETHSEN